MKDMIMKPKIWLIIALMHLFMVISLSSCGPSPEELSDEWNDYSEDKLVNKLSQIMMQKDINGKHVYAEFPTYQWSESTGYTTSYGTLVYKSGGVGIARLYNNYTNRNYDESGQWFIHFAPGNNYSPYESGIYFWIKDRNGTFSSHIGPNNMQITSFNEFCNKHLRDTDTQIIMAFGDSLRSAFMNEKGLTIGPDGRFK